MNQTDRPAPEPNLMSKLLLKLLMALRSKGLIVNETNIHLILDQDPELRRMAGQLSSLDFGPVPEPVDHQAEIERLREENQRDRDHKNRLMEELERLEVHLAANETFFKRSLLTMARVGQVTENTYLFPLLHQLRRVLGSNADRDQLEPLMDEIKDSLVEEASVTPGNDNSVKSTVLSGTPLVTSTIDSTEPDSGLNSMRRLLLDFVDRFQAEFDTRSIHGAIVELHRSLQEAGNLIGLYRHFAEILGLFRKVLAEQGQDQRQLMEFLKEIIGRIGELEALIRGSMASADQLHQENDRFSEFFNAEVREVETVMVKSGSLESLKQFISGKLVNLKQALEVKRKHDREQLVNLNSKMEQLNDNLSGMRSEISQAQTRNQMLELQSRTDPLTEIFNRRAYAENLASEFERFSRYGHVFSIIVFDIDHFKLVNDEHGHAVGDRCLQELARRVRSILRKVDIFARYGGEEFVVILPGTDARQVRNAAEKIRQKVGRMRFRKQDEEFLVTVSVGAAEVRPDDRRPEEVFERADAALYRAKEAGRNQTVVAD